MENKIPDILLVYPSEFIDELIEKEIALFNHKNIDIKVLKSDNKTFMALEWIIPTGFIVYILKPYFTAFLSEAGKDHYQILKKGLKKLIEKAKYIKAGFIASKYSTQKISKSYSQSVVISIIFQTRDNKPIKLLFDNKLELSEWENSIDEVLELLVENYNSYPEDRLTKMTQNLNYKAGKEIYAIINPESKKIELLDDNEMFKKYK